MNFLIIGYGDVDWQGLIGIAINIQTKFYTSFHIHLQKVKFTIFRCAYKCQSYDKNLPTKPVYLTKIRHAIMTWMVKIDGPDRL